MKTLQRRLNEKPRLSYAEEAALKKERQMLEDVQDEVEIKQGLKHELHDSKGVKDRIKKIDAELERSAERVSGATRVTLERREKALREFLQAKNPTWKTYSRLRPQDGVAYTELVEQLRRNNESPKYQRLVAEWKDIRRQLDPENPKAADTRYLMRQ